MKLYAKLVIVCVGEDGMGDTIREYQIESVSTVQDKEHTFEFEEGVSIKLPKFDYVNEPW